MKQSERLYALDNLRAVMMWLGIVLHVALNHVTVTTSAFWRDSATTPVADLILLTIHAFRMPVFFILAGYFVAFLAQGRGYGGMLKHRLRRLALPFAIFWPLLFVATAILVMMYLHVMARGTIGLDETLLPPPSPERAKISTLHLWFIYYLLWYCALAAALGAGGKFIPDGLKARSEQMWKSLGIRWWGFAVLALPLAAVGAFQPNGLVTASGFFLPRLDEFVHSGLFFLFGWYLYKNQGVLLPYYSEKCWRFAAGGSVAFLASVALMNAAGAIRPYPMHVSAVIAFAYNCAAWLWSFALIGMFIRYVPKQNAVLQYLSESSYWVYLVHMLGTIGFGLLIYKLPIGPFGKMALNIALTTTFSLATYHLLVRKTWVSVLLNGKRFAAKEQPLAQLAA